MQDPKVTFFPVGNGDCSQIVLSDGVEIVIDCNITEDARSENDTSRYDVHSHLFDGAKKLNGSTPYVNAFILTHPDQDHCRGFGTTFYVGDPSKYADKHLKDRLLLISELWFTPRVFSPHEKELCEEADTFRKEAKRRMELHRRRAGDRDLPGNRIRIIGYSDNPDLKGLEHVITTPGNYAHVVDGQLRTDFCFFVHAPFKIDTDDKWAERNDTSVVLQARFDVENKPDAGLALFGGDAGAAVWEKILERSDDVTLQWDILMAVHHCSWSFFSEEPYGENKTPANSSLAILSKKRVGAQIVASSKPIRDDDDNPPHWAAAQLYKSSVGSDNFRCTSETPTEKRPLPITFAVSVNGPVLEEPAGKSAVASSAAIQTAVGMPQTYG